MVLHGSRCSVARGTEPHASFATRAHAPSSGTAGLGEPASPRTYLCEAKGKVKTKSFTVQNSSIDFFLTFWSSVLEHGEL